jgi:Mor family transcriptional regulator
MGYIRAEEILPPDIIKLVQRYIDGENIYIPRKENNKKEWGTKTLIRQELMKRNLLIFADYKQGSKVPELATRYFLSEKTIQRIIRETKKDV